MKKKVKKERKNNQKKRKDSENKISMVPMETRRGKTYTTEKKKEACGAEYRYRYTVKMADKKKILNLPERRE